MSGFTETKIKTQYGWLSTKLLANGALAAGASWRHQGHQQLHKNCSISTGEAQGAEPQSWRGASSVKLRLFPPLSSVSLFFSSQAAMTEVL